MIVTIWRHGKAGDADTDFARELTARGNRDTERGAQCFSDSCRQRNLAPVKNIVFSPWVRTAQTAAIIGNCFPDASAEPSERIAPGAGLADVDGLLEERLAEESCEHVLLVSHQPLVSHLALHYLGNAGRSVPGLTPGGQVTLALSVAAADCARLLFWSLPPTYEAQR